jgi:hypothetical protein
MSHVDAIARTRVSVAPLVEADGPQPTCGGPGPLATALATLFARRERDVDLLFPLSSGSHAVADRVPGVDRHAIPLTEDDALEAPSTADDPPLPWAVADDLCSLWSTPDDDRRECPRRDGQGMVTVAAMDRSRLEHRGQHPQWLHEHGVTGELLDLSMSGLALALIEPQPVGAWLLVRISAPRTDETADGMAQVVRVVDFGDGRWKIVARFAQPLSFDLAYRLSERR